MRTTPALHPVVLAVLLPPATLVAGLVAWLAGASTAGVLLAALALPLAVAVVAPLAVLVSAARAGDDDEVAERVVRPEVVVPDEVARASAELRATLQGSDPLWSPTVLRREAAVRLARARLLQARDTSPPVGLDVLLALSHELRCTELAHWEAVQTAGGELSDEAQQALARAAAERTAARAGQPQERDGAGTAQEPGRTSVVAGGAP